MDLCNERQIKSLLARHGFRFSKSMGQNFLIVPSIPQDIASASGADSSCGVLEVGPGIGPLTVQLAQRAGKVVSVELDKSLLPILEETLAPFPNTQVISGDIMKLDLDKAIDQHLDGLTPLVCANLPYNITTPVLTKFLECGRFRSITVLIQREVARRICARPGTADYGSFTLFCQYHAKCELMFEVSSDCFLPAPKVTSAVLHMEPLAEHPVKPKDEALFFKTIQASFAQRRKKLLNGLTTAFSSQLSRDQLSQAIASCGFPETVRGEQLGLEEFCQLSDQLWEMLPH
ncbi:MAG: ribosomal RNA small subunit methyltransferase A [Oscillospiraceae bacterium]|nr:ribosomal RNA small subunit methyltransferase A [Oscillospiraceae bacterium]